MLEIPDILPKNPSDKIILLPTEELHNNTNNSNLCYCYAYLVVIIIIILLFVINFFYTMNGTNFPNYLNIPPEILCASYINNLEECTLQDLEENINCKELDSRVALCYDQVLELNLKCNVYFAEYKNCIQTKEKKLCQWDLKDIQDCCSNYKFISFYDIISFIKEN